MSNNAIKFTPLLLSTVMFIFTSACSNVPDEPGLVDIQQFIEENRLDEAEEFIQTALATYPRNADLYYNQSVVNRLQGQLLDARSSASKAFSYAPNDPNIKLLLAEYALEFGETDEALDLYQKLPSEIRSTPRALAVYGVLLSQQRKWQQAAVSFQNAVDQGGKNAATFAALANAFIQQGKVEEAKPFLKQAEELDATDPDSIRQIAECYLALSDAQKARDLAMPIANERPDDARTWSLVGRSEMILLRFSESESAFTRAITAPNTTPWHLVEYAMMLFAAEREDEALKKAAAAESQLSAQGIQIHNPSLYNLLATLYARDSQWLLANKYLTMSIQVDQNQPKVRELLVKVQDHFNASASPNTDASTN